MNDASPAPDPGIAERFSVGQQARMERTVTEDAVAAFVALTGDDNPMHVDEQFARESGIGGRVVHGMLTAGYVSTVIGTMLPGPGAIWLTQQFNFRHPVRIGDEILVEAEVKRISVATSVLVLEIKVTNQASRVVLDGQAQVQVLSKVRGVSDPALTPRTAVVTGSSRGIGAAVARRLAKDGLEVVVNWRSDETGAEEVVRAITDDGGSASSFRADVTRPDEVAALIAHAHETYGRVDALVNNAGGGMSPQPLPETTVADLDGHLDSHLRSAFECTQAVLPGMRERGGGRIVNITSEAAFGSPPPNLTGYAVAKAAVVALTKSAAVEAGPWGITVNAVAPGMTETAMIDDVPQRAKMTVAAQAPLRRLGSPEDTAEVVSFLLGHGGAYVTGQTLHVNGGQYLP